MYKCVKAITAEAYISTAWRRGSVVFCCCLLVDMIELHSVSKCLLHSFQSYDLDFRDLLPSVYDSDLGGARDKCVYNVPA